MKRLSKIDESVWVDIHKRSNGSQERKEDDINVMDMDMFFEYLQGLYKPTMSTYNVVIYHVPRTMILVPISINGLYSSGSVSYVSLEFDKVSDKKIVTLDIRSLHRLPEGCEYKLKEMYKIKYMSDSPKRQAHIIINPKDSSDVTNKFYIEIIDFMLDNIKDGYNRLVKKVELTSYVGESIWADMHKRSNGEQERKEDNIDKLDFHEFVSYLKDTYTIDDQTNFFDIGIFPTRGTDIVNISIPIEKKDIYGEDRNGNRMLTIGKDQKTDEFVNIRPNKYIFQLYPRELVKTFKDDFGIDYDLLELIPKNGKITNTMCVKVIDKLLSIVERPLLIKK